MGTLRPVVWGDRIFLTTAVPTSNAEDARRGLVEHKFMVLCYDRKTGKLLSEKVARVATPYQPYHALYGSFASNSSPIANISTRSSDRVASTVTLWRANRPGASQIATSRAFSGAKGISRQLSRG